MSRSGRSGRARSSPAQIHVADGSLDDLTSIQRYHAPDGAMQPSWPDSKIRAFTRRLGVCLDVISTVCVLGTPQSESLLGIAAAHSGPLIVR